jgi:simple sugar transport system permease protein
MGALGVYAAAMAVAFALVGGVLAAFGVDPFECYGAMLRATLLEAQGRSEVLRRAIPLLLIGGGLTVAFRAGFLNIGAEGQLLLGAAGASAVALFLPAGPASLPAMFAAGALAGALWAFPAVWLRSRLGVHEILTTLMLTPVAEYLVVYLINGPWRGEHVRGFSYTDAFPGALHLPVLPGTLVHWPTLALGAALAAVLQILLVHTPAGYEVRVVGESPRVARYAGISTARVGALVGLLSGGAAGLAGVGEVAGIHHRLLEPAQVSLGYGYTAIIVAWLARGRPASVLVTAPLLGAILAGGDHLKIGFNMPFRIIDVFSGTLLLCLITAEALWARRERRGA